MARNFIQPGFCLSIPALADIDSGDVVIVGSIVGVAAGDADTGETVDVITTGVYRLTKVAADDMGVGDVVYYDDATELVTLTATDNTRIGVAVEAAGDGAAHAVVRLSGF